MKTIEERCIDWGKERGIFDGDKINAWRAQYIKLLQEIHELKTAIKNNDLDEMINEAGDCYFVLNNLIYLAGDFDGLESVEQNEEKALDSALTMERPYRLIIHYRLLVNELFKNELYRAFLTNNNVDLPNERQLLEQTLAKNEKRKGKTINNNFIKE